MLVFWVFQRIKGLTDYMFLFLPSGEVRGQALLLVDGPLYPRCTHWWGGDPDAPTGEGQELGRGADQYVDCLHRRDDPKVNH